MLTKKRVEKQKRITLTSKEISELLAESIVTIVLLLLLNIAITLILSQLLENNEFLRGIIWTTKGAFVGEFKTNIFWSWNKFIFPVFLLLIFWYYIGV
ncbi:sensor histidine kinase [Melissococcus plutonius ATCC 35311]|uniref:Sensor histidine kinase n=1 Tax=Melissococcus plutonius (strain ATCC 35311 / DSM 29964 / CIP 104052 / LMG 20360 / NCIMB 702443) TaxID=940190 RepID=F3YCI5_MELPT|nr:sensor histidine kinase [Melissococcus plutonius ATCC 35311]